MCRASVAAGHDVLAYTYGNALLHRARNQALVSGREDADFVLFMDDDMLPLDDALNRLISHDLPVVSALCTTKVPPVRLALTKWHEPTHQWVALANVARDKVLSGQLKVGAAFLLLKKPIINQMIEYYLSASDWRDEKRYELDRLKVRKEARDAEQLRKSEYRRAWWDKEKIVRLFDYPITNDELQHGEDYGFCQKLLNMQIPVAVDTGVCVGHVGKYPYTAHSIWLRTKEEWDQLDPDVLVREPNEDYELGVLEGLSSRDNDNGSD